MYTGCSDLDMLLGGGIRRGAFYLFYGDEESGVDTLIHRIIAGSLLPPEQHGFGGRCIYINCGNYRHERTLLDVELLGGLVKAVGLDPVEAMNRVHTVCAFSEEQEEEMVEDVCSLVAEDSHIDLVVVHNIAKLFTGTDGRGRGSFRKIPRLEKVVGRIHQACSVHGAALIVNCRPTRAARGRIPVPEGGGYLRHRAGIIVYLRRVGGTPQVNACLLKHPYNPRKSVSYTFIGDDGMGRITTPFRTRLQAKLDDLKHSFYPALMDQGKRKAFESLVKCWTSEIGAMSYSSIPTVLDVMLLTALVDDRRTVMELGDRLNRLEEKLDKALNHKYPLKLPEYMRIHDIEGEGGLP